MTSAPPIAVLHLAPHPDDELLGAPATLLALRDAGHRVVNLACGLGRPEARARREAEVRQACARAGIELRLAAADLDEPGLAREVAAHAAELGAALVISPSPRDGHPAHEAVGRAARRALEVAAAPARWWCWGLWAELPFPTLLVPFGDARLAEIVRALEAHAGELARNDYRRLVRGRAQATAVLGPERVFGFGSRGCTEPFAEALTELVRDGAAWRLGPPRLLDAAAPLAVSGGGAAVDWWLDAPSDAARLRAGR